MSERIDVYKSVLDLRYTDLVQIDSDTEATKSKIASRKDGSDIWVNFQVHPIGLNSYTFAMGNDKRAPR